MHINNTLSAFKYRIHQHSYIIDVLWSLNPPTCSTVCSIYRVQYLYTKPRGQIDDALLINVHDEAIYNIMECGISGFQHHGKEMCVIGTMTDETVLLHVTVIKVMLYINVCRRTCGNLWRDYRVCTRSWSDVCLIVCVS